MFFFNFIFCIFHYKKYILLMKIHYLATSNIPSKTANSLQITKMCEGFSANGEDITLIVPNLICEKKTIKDYYDLNSSFKLIKIGKKKKLLNVLDNIFVPFNLVRHSLQINCDLIITRNLLISFILIFLKKKHIFEIHDDLRSSLNLLSNFQIYESSKFSEY